VQVDLPQLGAIDTCTGFRALRVVPVGNQEQRLPVRNLAVAVARAIDEADRIGLLGLGCPGDEYWPGETDPS
jgi:hypothetical protein